MITDKNKTPYAIYIQEDMQDKQYGVNQDEYIRGMVKYIRSDYFPTNSEMLEIAKKMTFYLDDRLCPYSREELRSRAWLEGYNFAKKNWEYSEGVQERITDYVQKEESESTSSNIENVTVYEFIKRFSHNNAVWVENVNNYAMYHKYRQNQEQKDGVVMDWELEYTDIAECNVVKISNVIHDHDKDAYTIVVDTDKTCFNFIPEKTTIDNGAPAWLYEEVHDLRKSHGFYCCGDECESEEKKKEDVIVPDFIKNAKAGDFLTTKYGHILLVDHVEISGKNNDHVRIYTFFSYDNKEDVLFKADFVPSFYGPKFTNGFYRPSTDQERKFMIERMKAFGYTWDEKQELPVGDFDEDDVKKMSNPMFWNVVKTIQWKSYYKEERVYESINSDLKDLNYNLDFLYTNAIYYANNLKERIEEESQNYEHWYAFCCRCGFDKGLSDDSLWYLCTHIVGMGRDVYLQVLHDPTLISEYKDYKEGFTYCFTS